MATTAMKEIMPTISQIYGMKHSLYVAKLSVFDFLILSCLHSLSTSTMPTSTPKPSAERGTVF